MKVNFSIVVGIMMLCNRKESITTESMMLNARKLCDNENVILFSLNYMISKKILLKAPRQVVKGVAKHESWKINDLLRGI